MLTVSTLQCRRFLAVLGLAVSVEFSRHLTGPLSLQESIPRYDRVFADWPEVPPLKCTIFKRPTVQFSALYHTEGQKFGGLLRHELATQDKSWILLL
ncbi:hypothetical protein B0H10DRAFT_950634 [Mycena sp. CBHHK59/15]|nr:hypothetical protein B0H10DRAFT_950634 [Mycena sp. CBHHK59/15]